MKKLSGTNGTAAFAAEHACFAEDEADIYTPAVTLWAFLSQVLHAERLRSCVAAAARGPY